HCVFHGLRKAACTRLADAGCTAHQIAAISGHKTLKEVERYTKGADQARLARAAMERIGNEIRAGRSVKALERAHKKSRRITRPASLGRGWPARPRMAVYRHRATRSSHRRGQDSGVRPAKRRGTRRAS